MKFSLFKKSPEPPEKFFIEDYSLSDEEKKMLVNMVSKDDFRIFEKYLANKQNRKAHKMVTAKTYKDFLVLQAQISLIGELTRDLAIFWEQIQDETKDTQEDRRQWTLFGENRLPI